MNDTFEPTVERLRHTFQAVAAHVVDAPPVRFRRARGMLPLPAPVPGGRLDALRELINVRDDDGWMQELLVEDVMKPAPVSYRPEDSLDSVQALLAGGASTSCVLVEQDGRLIGVVSARDLLPRAELLEPGERASAEHTGGQPGQHPELNLR